MVRRSLLAGAAVAMLALSSQAVRAADAASPQTDAISTVADVVVTARRVAEDAQKIPLAVTVLGSVQLQNRNIRTLNDFVTAVPDVQLIDAADNTSAPAITIRGQGSPDDSITTDPAVGVYYDGVYIPRANGLKFILQDFDEIGQAEVLRGPQGALFGRNTTGGAFNITSKAPGPDYEAYGRVDFGNFSLRDVAVGANIPLAPGAALRLAYEHVQHDGYASDSLGFPQQSQDTDFVHGRILAEPTDRLSFDASVSYLRFTLGEAMIKLHDFNPASLFDPNTAQTAGAVIADVLAESGLDPTNPANFPIGIGLFESSIGGDPSHNGGAQDVPPDSGGFFNAALTLTYKLSGALSLKSITGVTNTRREGFLDLDATPFHIISAQSFTASRAWSEELQAIFTFGPVDGVAGGYFFRETGEDAQFAGILAGVGAPAFVYDGDAVNRSDALFGQANWHVTPRLTLTGGLRYTWDSKSLTSFNHTGGSGLAREFVVPTDAFGLSTNPAFGCLIAPNLQNVAPGACEAHFINSYSALTWTGSVSYQVSEEALAYAKASRGYRGGGENLRGGALTFTPFGPEYVTQYELGLKSTLWDRRARLNLAAFYSNYSNIQLTNIIVINVGGQTIAGTTILNAGKAHLEGVEAEAVVIPVSRLTLSATADWFHGKYTQYQYAGVDETSQPWGPPDYTVDLLGRYEVPAAFGAVSAQADLAINGRTPLSLGDITACIPTGSACVYDTRQVVWGPVTKLLSARLTVHLAGWRTDVSLWGRNLTNQRFYNELLGPIDSRVFNVGYLNDPRTYGVEISKRF
jgi:iron complex outermembrane receptor protein